MKYPTDRCLKLASIIICKGAFVRTISNYGIGNWCYCLFKKGPKCLILAIPKVHKLKSNAEKITFSKSRYFSRL